jgi:hypothetical protein
MGDLAVAQAANLPHAGGVEPFGSDLSIDFGLPSHPSIDQLGAFGQGEVHVGHVGDLGHVASIGHGDAGHLAFGDGVQGAVPSSDAIGASFQQGAGAAGNVGGSGAAIGGGHDVNVGGHDLGQAPPAGTDQIAVEKPEPHIPPID